MTAFSTSKVTASGSTGTIEVLVSDKIGGGDIHEHTVDVLVSVESGAYVCTGGTPLPTSYFGNNGARWSDVTFTGSTTIEYDFRPPTGSGSSYVVMIIDKKDDAFDVHWGTIAPTSTVLSMPSPLQTTDLRIDWDFLKALFRARDDD